MPSRRESDRFEEKTDRTASNVIRQRPGTARDPVAHTIEHPEAAGGRARAGPSANPPRLLVLRSSSRLVGVPDAADASDRDETRASHVRAAPIQLKDETKTGSCDTYALHGLSGQWRDTALAVDAEGSPSRYIARISLRTGKEIRGPIVPRVVGAVASGPPSCRCCGAVSGESPRAVRRRRSCGLQLMRQINRVGRGLARAMGSLTGSATVERGVKRLIGVPNTQHYFRFRPATPLGTASWRAPRAPAARGARQLRRVAPDRVCSCFSPGDGICRQEILARTAGDLRIARVVCLLRPETVRDRSTGAVMRRTRRRSVARGCCGGLASRVRRHASFASSPGISNGRGWGCVPR